MLSGRGLRDELIARPEEAYRLWCVIVCDLETSRMGAPYIYIYIYTHIYTYIYIYDISSLRVKTMWNSTYTLENQRQHFRQNFLGNQNIFQLHLIRRNFTLYFFNCGFIK